MKKGLKGNLSTTVIHHLKKRRKSNKEANEKEKTIKRGVYNVFLSYIVIHH